MVFHRAVFTLGCQPAMAIAPTPVSACKSGCHKHTTVHEHTWLPAAGRGHAVMASVKFVVQPPLFYQHDQLVLVMLHTSCIYAGCPLLIHEPASQAVIDCHMLVLT